MRKKLVFFTDSLAGGGASRVICNLANRMSEKYRIEIVCLYHIPQRYKTNDLVDVVYLDEISTNWIGKIIALRKRVNRDDIVIAFMIKYYCMAIIAILGKHVRIIASERNDPKQCSTIWKICRKLLLPNVSAFVVQTQSIKDYFSYNIKKKTQIIVNPVSEQQYSQLPWDESSRIVVAVGNLTPQKNYTMMINAFCRFHTKHPDFKLEIYGNEIVGNIINEGGSNSLKKLVGNLNADEYISFMGNADDVASVHSKAYMFVMSSNYEGMSNALIEAMCSGLPIVSTKVSGAVDLIKDRQNGLLVDVGDEDGFSKAMSLLVEDVLLAKDLSDNVRTSRRYFVEDHIFTQWEQLIENVANKSN